VPIDWPHLLRDLLDWERPDRAVQRDWARGFWGRQIPQAAGQATAASLSYSLKEQGEEVAPSGIGSSTRRGRHHPLTFRISDREEKLSLLTLSTGRGQSIEWVSSSSPSSLSTAVGREEGGR